MDSEHAQHYVGTPASENPSVMQPPVEAVPEAKSSWLGRSFEHPLQAILGAALVLLLGFALTQTNDRISRLEDRFDRLEDKVDDGFARVDERFAQQDAKFEEINLKLTALIAAFNMTAEVDAAVEGTPLRSNAATTDGPTPQPN